MAMLAILILPLMYLGWTAVAAVNPQAVSQLGNPGPHGFSEMLYLYTSSTGNNGSAFAGISGNTMFFNITGAVAMLVGRFWMIIPAIAIAGSLAAKKSIPPSAGTFSDHGRVVCGTGGWGHCHHRRAYVLPGARARTDRRATCHDRRHHLCRELMRSALDRNVVYS